MLFAGSDAILGGKKYLLPITSRKGWAEVSLITVILHLPSRKTQNDTFPRIYLPNGFQEISKHVWIQWQRSPMISWKMNDIQMDPVMSMVSSFKPVWGTVLFTCSAVVTAFISFRSYPSALHTDHYHVPVVTKIFFPIWNL